MTAQLCQDCVERPELGQPSFARWVGPDGEVYCSLHFIHRFGHAERLVRIDGYEAPTRVKPPLAKKGA